jgi:hypothetical protein
MPAPYSNHESLANYAGDDPKASIMSILGLCLLAVFLLPWLVARWVLVRLACLLDGQPITSMREQDQKRDNPGRKAPNRVY